MIAFSKEIQIPSFIQELNFGSFIKDFKPINKSDLDAKAIFKIAGLSILGLTSFYIG